MKIHPSSAIEKGFTAQLTNSVTPMPFHWRRTPPSAPKSIFSSIGMIISQISTATGRFTWATCMPPSAAKLPGSRWPSSVPATMHSSTQRVSQRSKKPMRAPSGETAPAASAADGWLMRRFLRR